jgi:hypothetical protein
VNLSQTAHSARLASRVEVLPRPVNANKLTSADKTPALIARGASQNGHRVEENKRSSEDQGQGMGTQKGERGDGDRFSETVLVHVLGSRLRQWIFLGDDPGQASLRAGIRG